MDTFLNALLAKNSYMFNYRTGWTLLLDIGIFEGQNDIKVVTLLM